MPVLVLLAAAALSAPAPQVSGPASQITAPAPQVSDLAPTTSTPAASTFRPGMLLQTWVAGTESGLPHAALRLRRLELQAKGEWLGGSLRYGLSGDLARALEPLPLDGTPISSTGGLLKPNLQPAALIKDMYATVRTPVADILVGQAKIPVSLEGFTSSGNLLFPERAAVSTEFGDKRDLGVQVIRGFGPVKATAGLFARRTIADLAAPPAGPAPPRDGALRVDLVPLSGLQLGALAYGTVIGRGMAAARDRGELDVRWEPGPIFLQGELIQGTDIETSGAHRHSLGTYATAGYRITDQIQPVMRLGFLNRDLDGAVGTLNPATQLDLGLNYAAPIAGTRVQASYSLTWSGSPAPVQSAVLVGQYRY